MFLIESTGSGVVNVPVVHFSKYNFIDTDDYLLHAKYLMKYMYFLAYDHLCRLKAIAQNNFLYSKIIYCIDGIRITILIKSLNSSLPHHIRYCQNVNVVMYKNKVNQFILIKEYGIKRTRAAKI